MLDRELGSTGIRVSPIALGAGPVSGLMTGGDRRAQTEVVAHAVDRGINWIDTAATYGQGRSEESLGRALAELRIGDRVHVATKVRIDLNAPRPVIEQIHESVDSSLRRLRLERLTLLQLHNSITHAAGDEPTSLPPELVLSEDGVLGAFDALRQVGKVVHIGITGLGHPQSMAKVLRAGHWATVQTPYSLLNPSAGCEMPAAFGEANYGNLFATCNRHAVGVFAIRVYAAGALLGQQPSAHTLKTPFFPLDLYRRDERRATQLAKVVASHGITLQEAAVRFVVTNPAVSSAMIGFANRQQIDAAIAAAEAGPLPGECAHDIDSAIANNYAEQTA